MLKHRTYSKMASGSMGRWVSAPLLMLGFYSMVPKVNGCIAVGHGIFQNGWFSPADVVIVPCPVSSMRQHKKEWRFTQHIEALRHTHTIVLIHRQCTYMYVNICIYDIIYVCVCLYTHHHAYPTVGSPYLWLIHQFESQISIYRGVYTYQYLSGYIRRFP